MTAPYALGDEIQGTDGDMHTVSGVAYATVGRSGVLLSERSGGTHGVWVVGSSGMARATMLTSDGIAAGSAFRARVKELRASDGS